jgi:ATP-dependent RNA helicase DOB1
MELQSKFDDIQFEKFNLMSSYHDIREQLDQLSGDFRSYLTKPEYLLPFLQPGRMVKVRNILLF